MFELAIGIVSVDRILFPIHLEFQNFSPKFFREVVFTTIILGLLLHAVTLGVNVGLLNLA